MYIHIYIFIDMGLFENRVPPNPIVHHHYLRRHPHFQTHLNSLSLDSAEGIGQDGLSLLKWRLDRRADELTWKQPSRRGGCPLVVRDHEDYQRTSQNDGNHVTCPSRIMDHGYHFHSQIRMVFFGYHFSRTTILVAH